MDKNSLDIILEALEAYGCDNVDVDYDYVGQAESISFKYQGHLHWLGSEDTTAGAYSTAFIYNGQ